MTDGVFVTRTAGIGCEGVQDQYADGKAARVWESLVGGDDKDFRTRNYKSFLVDLLKKKGCKRILDVACGTGVDSIMLLEEGFDVISIDASDKMLKYAFKRRWERRKETAFDNWVIREANWLSLPEDIADILDGGFDALVCLGNSFAHLVDISGDQSKQRLALSNFQHCIRPGGLLVIDHRNFDAMLDFNKAPKSCIYYRTLADVATSVLYTDGRPIVLTLDYKLKLAANSLNDKKNIDDDESAEFRLSYFPHRLKDFTDLVLAAFPKATHTVLADFKSPVEVENPGFYIHILQEPKN